MLVVADNAPLNHLVRLGTVDVLRVLFGRVVIPSQVADEMLHSRTPDIVRSFVAHPPGWLTIQQPIRVEPIPGLDPGEEAAISLAQELAADLLLIDDRDGRRAAAARRVAVIGTIGVLERAARAGLLDLERAFVALSATDFRIRPVDLEERLRMFRRHDAAG